MNKETIQKKYPDFQDFIDSIAIGADYLEFFGSKRIQNLCHEKRKTINIEPIDHLPNYVNKFISSYHTKGNFPRVIIYDDALLYGGHIQWAIDELYKAIKLKDNSIPDNEIKDKLYKSVIIRAYACSNICLLQGNYRIFSEYIFTKKDTRKIILELSEYTKNKRLLNENNLAAISLNDKEISILKQQEKPTIYRDIKSSVYMRLRTPHVLETITIQKNKNSDSNYVMPFVLFDTKTYENFEQLCSSIAKYFQEKTKNSSIDKILTADFYSSSTKSNIISYIYSILCLVDFYKNNLKQEDGEIFKTLVENEEFSNNLLQIKSWNTDLYTEILSLLRNICENPNNVNYLWKCLDENTQNIICDDSLQVSNEIKQINFSSEYEEIEEAIYIWGADSEYAATRISRSITDSKDIENFKKNSILRMCYIPKKLNDCEVIARLLSMQNSRVLHIRQDIEHICTTIIEAGELAPYIIPERIKDIMPALADIENCTSNKIKSKLIKDFIDTIAKDKSVPLNKKKNYLKNMKEALAYVYLACQTFNEWENIFPPSIENDVTEYYQDYAKKYLRNKTTE